MVAAAAVGGGGESGRGVGRQRGNEKAQLSHYAKHTYTTLQTTRRTQHDARRTTKTGGPDAPPLAESLTNLGINSAALAVLTFLLIRDLRGREADVKVTRREEALSRLLVRAGGAGGGGRSWRQGGLAVRDGAGRAAGRAAGSAEQPPKQQLKTTPSSPHPKQTAATQIKLGPERQLPLIRFRGAVRPVIVAGDRSFVERAVKAAEPYQSSLRARGVSGAPGRGRGGAGLEGAAGRASASNRHRLSTPHHSPIAPHHQTHRITPHHHTHHHTQHSHHLVIPVVYLDDPEEKLRALKRELQQQRPAAGARGFGGRGGSGGGGGGGDGGPDADGAAAAEAEAAAPAGIGNSESLTEDDRRWRLEPAAVAEWEVRGLRIFVVSGRAPPLLLGPCGV